MLSLNQIALIAYIVVTLIAIILGIIDILRKNTYEDWPMLLLLLIPPVSIVCIGFFTIAGIAVLSKKIKNYRICAGHTGEYVMLERHYFHLGDNNGPVNN